ncbi:MAG: glycosyltransferase family 2 protein [Bacteroidota bacterium]
MVPREAARSGASGRRSVLSRLLPRFSIAVPTRGDASRLDSLLDALARQTLPRAEYEIIVAFDGLSPPAALCERMDRLGARFVMVQPRRGPGAARNAAAREARGEWLAFTEDDCVPDPDWLAAAARRIDSEEAFDVLEGSTRLPGGSPVRRRGAGPTWLPTNLFIRRALFERVGGYAEEFFDPRSGVYFREDSDLGFTLAAVGARVRHDPEVGVVHPREHAGWLDPIRWARRYEMDPLLMARHPERFHDEIEVVRWGPLRLRRPFVRACLGVIVAGAAAAVAAVLGETGLAVPLLGVALLLLLLIWGKWRWDPRKLPAALAVPPVLLVALWRGRARARAHLVAVRTTR